MLSTGVSVLAPPWGRALGWSSWAPAFPCTGGTAWLWESPAVGRGDWAPGLLCTGGTGPWHSPVLGRGGSPQYWGGTGPHSPARGELPPPPPLSPFCSPCTRVWGGAREPKPCPLHHLPAYPAAARRIFTVRPEGVGIGVSQSARRAPAWVLSVYGVREVANGVGRRAGEGGISC